MPARPTVVAFDVNETLFSLGAIERRLRDIDAPDGTLERWFDRVLKDGFARTAAGDGPAFRTLAHDTLARMLDDPDGATTVLSAFAELEAHPDVAPALHRLADAGIGIVTLTNGHAETTAQLLARSGLDHLVDRCFDVTASGRWKPAPAPYRWCARQVGVDPDALALIAVHSWDVHGARRAGLVTGWARRHEGAANPAFDRADVEADDLVGVVDGVLALPEWR